MIPLLAHVIHNSNYCSPRLIELTVETKKYQDEAISLKMEVSRSFGTQVLLALCCLLRWRR